ncbi:MAG: TlpA family protein disulfide reductase [Sulfuritalea sp.]|jgi:thiol-disulfide isomerase/thioredoxin|nr:TlpA family protein disulfide reductase [Sulfuritalea sp.]
MKTSRLWLMLAGIALIAAAIGYRWGVRGEREETPTVATSALPIFELVLADLKGQSQGIGQWRGKVLVVNYWATWCPPCLEEMPGFSRLQDKYRDKGVQFVGISIDNAAKILEFEKTTPVSYPLLIGDIGVMEKSAALGNTRQALPFTAVFDRQGRLSATKLGRFTEADLERELIELMSR